MTNGLIVVIVILGLFVIGVIAFLFNIYNGLIEVQENIKKSLANIDVILKQRVDEIPKLIKTVEAFMKYEKGIINELVEARKALLEANSISEKGEASGLLSKAFGNIIAWGENYPEIKASGNFKHFQERVSELEETLANRREFYNSSVNSYNIRIKSIPEVFLASALGMKEKEMFLVAHSDKRNPKINFDIPA